MVEHDTPLEKVGRLATLAQRAGLDGLWLAPGDGRWLGDDWLPAVFERLAAAAARTETLTLGAYLARVPTTPSGLATRLEVTVPDGAQVESPFEARVIVAMDGVPAGPRPQGVSGALLPVAAVSEARPPPDWPSLALEVGASIGRTASEAAARVERDSRLRGRRDPRAGGLFGTLEECQSWVAELGRLGVTELRCWLPDLPDVGDVIAQLSAVKVSGPDTPARGRPPAPPAGWGGRPRRAGRDANDEAPQP
jgi:hypothetical protein